MKPITGQCKQCECSFRKTSRADTFCCRDCAKTHKNKVSNELWLQDKKAPRRHPNAANIFAGTGCYVGFTDLERRCSAIGGI